jgi:hypothetical protein
LHAVLCVQEDGTSTARTLGGKRHVCAGLRRLAGQRLAEITQNFLWMISLSARGSGQADRSKMQNVKFAKIEISKIANFKTENRENFHHIFFREIDRETVFCKLAFLFSRSKARLLLFASWRPLLHSQSVRCMLHASKQCPNEATTSTRLNSHGTGERTQEDTMNPMRRSPSLLIEI